MNKLNYKSKLSVINMQYMLIFAMIFFSNDTTLFGTNMDQRFVRLGYMLNGLLVLLFTIASAIKNNQKITINIRMLRIWLIMCSCVLLSSIVNRDFRGGYATSILLMLLGCSVSIGILFENYCKIFARIFKFLAGCSVFGKLILDWIPALYNVGIFVQRSTGLVFRHYIFYARSTEELAGSRNYSIFREPGVFQGYLIVALLICILSFDKKRQNREYIGIVILVIAIYMTKSTTAYLGLGLVSIIYLVCGGYFRVYKKFGFFLIGAVSAMITITVYFNFYMSSSTKETLKNIFIDKFDSNSIYFESGFARIASIGTNIYLWLQNPIFGVGVTEKQVRYVDVSKKIYGFQTSIDTNSIIAQFSLYGVVIGILWVLAVIGLSKEIGKSKIERALLFMLIMMILMTEYLVYSSICNVFIWYGLKCFFVKGCRDDEKKICRERFIY